MRAASSVRSIRGVAVAAAVVTATAVAAGSARGQSGPSFDEAAEELRRAVAELDRGELERLADRFAGFAESGRRPAEARYGEGVAIHASIWTPTFGNPGFDPGEIRARLDRSDEALRRALEERPDLVEARALRLFNRILRGTYQEEDARRETHRSAQQAALELVERHPDHPGGLAMHAFALLQTSPEDFAEEGVAHLVRARELIAERTPRDVLGTQLWSLFPLVLSARTNMFVLTDFREAKRAADTGARLEPPLPPLRRLSGQLRHAVGHRVVERAALPRGEWRLLAEDPEGDVDEGAAADGRALSYQIGDGGSTVWLKFQTHGSFPADGFGINLVIDDDADQETGRPWWGGDSDFRFDRLVAVWVVRHESGTYDGWVGVTDAEAAYEQDMISILAGGLDFRVLEEESAVVVGVPRSALPAAEAFPVIGAVGSTMSWSDNLPDDGPVTLSLEG